MISFPRPPVSSRAALTEIERQRRARGPRPDPGLGHLHGPSPAERAPRAAADDETIISAAPDKKEGASGGEPKKKGDKSKGSGQKDEVQRKPEDQKGRANPTEGEGRGAY